MNAAVCGGTGLGQAWFLGLADGGPAGLIWLWFFDFPHAGVALEKTSADF
jgi:hypothetical protein